MLLQTFPQQHRTVNSSPVSVDCFSFLIVVFLVLADIGVSVPLSLSSAPPLGRLWGYCSFCSFVALVGALLRVLLTGLLALCAHASLSWRSAVSPASPTFLGCHLVFPRRHWKPRDNLLHTLVGAFLSYLSR